MFEVNDLIPETPADDALWLRQSTVGSWELCPGRVGHSQDKGFNNLPSEAMSWGTLTHAMCEADLSGTFIYHSTPQVVELWGKLVRDEYHIEIEDLASEEQIVSGAQEALGAYHLWVDNVKPLLPGGPDQWEVERRLTAFLGWLDSGREVWLHGTGDLLVPDYCIGFDWKTAGRGWKDSKAHFIGQPSAYTFLALQEFGKWVDVWQYFVYDRSKMTWDLHTTTRSEQQVASWLRHTWNIAKAIDAQAFPYTPTQDTFGAIKRGWHCSAKYCGAWNVCPAKWLNDDVDESEVALTSWS